MFSIAGGIEAIRLLTTTFGWQIEAEIYPDCLEKLLSGKRTVVAKLSVRPVDTDTDEG